MMPGMTECPDCKGKGTMPDGKRCDGCGGTGIKSSYAQ
jgi:DnaJ-class molecular chaperone